MNQQWTQPAQPEPGAPGEPVIISWVWPRGMAGLSLVNFLLTILTLGVYRFWGTTEVRKRIWSAIRIQGEPLVYTGKGSELFIGFLIAFFAIVLPMSLAYTAAVIFLGPEIGLLLFFFAIYPVLIYLIGVGTYSGWRYRLSRTRWRGIRGALAGNPWKYGWTFFWTTMLSAMTLGWSIPWQYCQLQRDFVNDIRFGDRPLAFNARSGPLYGPFAVAWIGAFLLYIGVIVGIMLVMMPGMEAQGPENYTPGVMEWVFMTLIVVVALGLFGLASAWFSARMMNHFAAHTWFEGARFRADATAWSMFGLEFTNLLLVIFTLGLLAPVAQARSMGYLVSRLSLDGPVALDAISQGATTGGRYGEGVAIAFDIDAF